MWKKLGQVYVAPHDNSWRDNSALTPTPMLMPDGGMRVYCSFRDRAGVGRIGFVDLDINDPTRVLRISAKPVLDIGEPGTFDDNGVILGDIVFHENKFLMFYVGFQLVRKAKFLAFTGLAESSNGLEFVRVSTVPMIDRRDTGRFIQAVHTAWYEQEKWRIWYAEGDHWETIGSTDYPSYLIKYTETTDLKNIPNGICCLRPNEGEYRIGRPRVFRKNSKYHMLFTCGTLSGAYFPGYASSDDGVTWVRDDERFCLKLSSSGWDSKHLSYPALMEVNEKILVCYNGNDMGKEGFGVAYIPNDAFYP